MWARRRWRLFLVAAGGCLAAVVLLAFADPIGMSRYRSRANGELRVDHSFLGVVFRRELRGGTFGPLQTSESDWKFTGSTTYTVFGARRWSSNAGGVTHHGMLDGLLANAGVVGDRGDRVYKRLYELLKTYRAEDVEVSPGDGDSVIELWAWDAGGAAEEPVLIEVFDFSGGS